LTPGDVGEVEQGGRAGNSDQHHPQVEENLCHQQTEHGPGQKWTFLSIFLSFFFFSFVLSFFLFSFVLSFFLCSFCLLKNL
jgi:hypothetical protein